MLCCVSSGLCCAGEVACSTLCCLCSLCGLTPRNFSKVAYVFLDLAFVGVSIALMFTLQPLFERYDFLQCNSESGGGDSCLGTAAVLRMSFVLFLFHLTLLVVMLPRCECSAIIHNGCWCAKVLVIIAAYVAVFWIPNSFYWGWAHFARAVSGIYLIIQVALLIVAAFTINDKLVAAYESQRNICAAITLVLLTFLFTGGTIAFQVMQYIWFHSCGGTLAITIVTTVVTVIFYGLNLLKSRSDGSIFTASLVSAYVSYIGWSAMASVPDQECNPFVDSLDNFISQLVIGATFTFLSLFETASMIQSEGDSSGRQIVAEAEDTEKNPETGNFPVSKQNLVFQAIVLIATLYYPMLITNWGDPIVNSDRSDFFKANWASFWVKIAAQWACMLLYLWSLVAPMICKGRDFTS